MGRRVTRFFTFGLSLEPILAQHGRHFIIASPTHVQQSLEK